MSDPTFNLSYDLRPYKGRGVSDDRKYDFHGAPITRMPGWTRPVEGNGAYLELFPPIDFEVALQLEDYFIFSTYAPAVVDFSLDDGPVRRMSRPTGSAFFAPPQTLIRARMSTPVECLIMAVSPERATAAIDRTAAGRPWAPQVIVNFVDPGFAALQLEIRRSLLGDPLVAREYIASIADSMLARLGCRIADIPVGGSPKESLPPGLLRRIVEQIEADLANRVAVEDLARDAGLSRSHFSRAFQAATGESPQQFIIGRRLSRARELLAESDRSIAEIAAETGFSSHAHLSTAFKKRLGVTPAAYRQAFESSD